MEIPPIDPLQLTVRVAVYIYQHPELMEAGITSLDNLMSKFNMKYGNLGFAALQREPFSQKAQEEAQKRLKKANASLDPVLREMTSQILVALSNPDLDKSHRAAGEKAIQQYITVYLKDLLDVRMTYDVADVNLLSENVGRTKNIPKNIKQKAGNFQSSIRAMITKVTKGIEERHTLTSKPSFNPLSLTVKQRKPALQLLSSDQKIHSSYRTIRTTFEIFSGINQNIILNANAHDSQKILGNAILIFELTNYIINYLREFKVNGMNDLNQIYSGMKGEMAALQRDDYGLWAKAKVFSLMDARHMEDFKAISQDIENRKQAMKRLEYEWETYLNENKTLEAGVHDLKRLTSTLELRRDNAKNQIKATEMLAAFMLLKQNTETFQQMTMDLTKIELIPLTQERVQRLLIST